MRVVVTGGLGHIGSQLVRELPLDFCDVELVIVDNLATQRYPSLFNLPLGVKYEFVHGDVTTMDLLPVFAGADVVVHLAAMTDPGVSFDQPEVMERVNFIATKRVAEACAANFVPLIHASSTSIYGTKKNIVDEDCTDEDILPQSPYAITKLKEELLVQSMCQSGELSAMSFRFGTIFGVSPGMRFHTAVNKFCWQAAIRQPITVWKTAYNQTRPYLDLTDAISAIKFVICNKLFDGRVYNAVSVNTSVCDVLDTIGRYICLPKIEMVDSRAMNSLSFMVLNKRMTENGFVFEGDLDQAVEATLRKLRNINASH